MMDNEKLELLKNAIDKKQKIEFRYKKRRRVADPHMLGNRNKDGGPLLYSWQSAGDSKRGGIPDHRCFNLSKMKNLTLLDEKFETCEGYKPNEQQKIFSKIIAQIKI